MNLLKISLITCFSFMVFNPVFSQDEKEQRKHAEAISKSLEKKMGVLSLDTIFYLGKPYCIFKVESKMLGNILRATCKGLDGKDVFWVSSKSGSEVPGANANDFFNDITFAESNARALYRPNTITTSLVKDIVNFNLFSEGKLNPQGEQRFVAAFRGPYGYYPGTTTVVVNTNGNANVIVSGSANSNDQVRRNRNGMIFVSGNQIKQDNILVGTFQKAQAARNGTIETEYIFFLPNGSAVAKAIAKGATSHDYSIQILNTGGVFTVNSNIGRDDEDLAKFLIQSGNM